MSQNSSYALNYFLQQGYTPSQAAGIVGNLMQESGPNLNLTGGDSGISQGIAQWNGGRLTALQDYAKQQGSDWKSLDTQLGFVNQELNGSENKAGQAIHNAQDVASATAAAAGYERPQGWTPDNPSGANAFDKRLAYASQLVGGNGIDAPASNVTTSAQSLVNPPLASAAMVKPTAPDAFSQLQNAQPTALSQLFGGGQQQPMQAQAQQPQISDQDVAAELQRRGLAPQAQTMPDISDDQVKQELQRRGLGQPPDLFHATPEQRQTTVDADSRTPQQHSDAYNMTMRPIKGGLAGLAGILPDTFMLPGKFMAGVDPSRDPTGAMRNMPSVTNMAYDALDKILPTDQPTTMEGFLGLETAKAAGGLGLPLVAKALGSGVSALSRLVNPGAEIGLTAPSGKAITANERLMPFANVTPEQADKVMAGVKSPVPMTSQDIRGLATQAYQTAADKGGTLTPQFTDKFIEDASKLAPQTEAGKIVTGENAVTKLVDNLNKLKGRPLSLAEAQEIDESMSSQIDDLVDPVTGKLTKQAKILSDIQTGFRNKIENAGSEDVAGGTEGFDALKQGRKLWGAQARMGDVERIIARAQNKDQPAKAIASGFDALQNNPNRLRGFSAAEKSAIKNAAKTGIAVDALRLFGSRLTEIGSTVVGGSVGGVPGAIASGLVTHAVSSSARGAAKALQMVKATKVLETISKGAR